MKYILIFLAAAATLVGNGWYEEKLYDDWQQKYKIGNILYEEKTPFQHLIIFENSRFGKVLALDGVIQTTDAFEYIYHEMIAHVPLVAHPNPEKVLIIGGGDGGTLREVLRHPSVKKAVMVEIDPSVIKMSEKYFPEHSAGAFQDPRAQIVIADGIEYVKNTEEKFDVIICDSTDPIGPGAVLFTEEFYGYCSKALGPSGIFVNQNGVPAMQGDELQMTFENRSSHFSDVRFYLAAIPHYVGGFMALGWASNDLSYADFDIQALEKRAAAIQSYCKYYSAAVHRAAFALPPYVQACYSTSAEE
jgi:spermidine synthase